MAFDAFLKMTDVFGESTDAKHKDELEILSFSWGLDQTGTVFASGEAEVSELNLMTRYSRASVKLVELAALGGHSDEARLTLRSTGDNQFEFLKYKFTDVLVSNYQTSGSEGGDDRPIDSFSLNFAKIEIEYAEQKEDGSIGIVHRFRYDLSKKSAT